MKWIKKHLITLILITLALAGAALIVYPTFSDWWNSFHQSRAIATYTQAVASLDEEQYDRILKSAKQYNKELTKTGMLWNMTDEQKADYESELKVDDTGIMGYITIPKIGVNLPIYHGVDESVLQVAIGHLTGTSLPIGGKSTHTVVSGHRGLPSAKLFTDIDKLVVGDTWTITVLNRTVSYEVDQIRIVEPTDLSDLRIEEGKDYCTLVTCTPYGINTHRLLVRGHRVKNPQGDADIIADALQIDPNTVALFVAVPIVIILLALWIIYLVRHRKKEEARWKALKEKNESNSEGKDHSEK